MSSREEKREEVMCLESHSEARLRVPEGSSLADMLLGDGSPVPGGFGTVLSAAIGTRWAGEIDRAPGVLYVSTYFIHIVGLPLVPLRSWVVLLDLRGSKTAASTTIGWNFKSILMAYVRAISFVAALALGMSSIGGMIGFVSGVNRPLLPVLLGGGAIGFLVVLLFSWKFAAASEHRAREHALIAGFSEDEADSIARDIRLGSAFDEVIGSLCPGCGRELARSTRVCPRCERRL